MIFSNSNDVSAVFRKGGDILFEQSKLKAKKHLRSLSVSPQQHPTNRNNMEVTRYFQKWNLNLQEEESKITSVVNTHMEIDYRIDTEGLSDSDTMYACGHKSIATSEVSDLLVYDGVSGKELNHSIFTDASGYQILHWWFNEPILNNSASVLVDYVIHDGINGCEKEAYCGPLGCVDRKEITLGYSDIQMQKYCSESFRAPWVNQWDDVPVSDISYEFSLPKDTHQIEFLQPSVVFEPSSHYGKRWKYEYNSSNSSTTTETIFVKRGPIKAGDDVIPDRPAFTWYINDVDGLVPHCRKSCSSSSSVPPPYVHTDEEMISLTAVTIIFISAVSTEYTNLRLIQRKSLACSHAYE